MVKVAGSIPAPAPNTTQNDKDMKTLTLSIKQKWFDEIISGKKTQEFREIRPTNAKKYFRYVLNGKMYTEETLPPEDEEPGEVDLAPVKYDAIKFLTGAYTGTRPWALVEVKDAHIELLADENGNEITYEYNGNTYSAAQIVYDLGRILERSDV